jgi:hypothetical protein
MGFLREYGSAQAMLYLCVKCCIANQSALSPIRVLYRQSQVNCVWQVEVKMKAGHLFVRLADKTIIDSKLSCLIHPEDSTWQLGT